MFLLFIGIPGIIYFLLKDKHGGSKAGLYVITGVLGVFSVGCLFADDIDPQIPFVLFPSFIFALIGCFVSSEDRSDTSYYEPWWETSNSNYGVQSEYSRIGAKRSEDLSVESVLWNALKGFKFGGLQEAISSCVENGVLNNRATGEQYDVMQNKTSLDIQKCITMVVQSKVWDMKNYTNINKYLKVSISDVPLPDMDIKIGDDVRRDAVIRYILVKHNWTDTYIKRYMTSTPVHTRITPEYFDEYYAEVKEFLDQYPLDRTYDFMIR